MSVTDSNGVVTSVPTYVMDRFNPGLPTPPPSPAPPMYYAFAHFAFQGNVVVNITAKSESAIASAQVSPLALGIKTSPGSAKNSVTFPLATSRYLVVKIDSLNELVIAADPPETNVPASSGTLIYNVTSSPYHADPTGATEATTAFLAAIAAAGSHGTAGAPGIVYVPDGIYKLGQLMLPSNVTLYLSGSAVLQAAVSPATPYIAQYNEAAANYGAGTVGGQTACSASGGTVGTCSISGFWFIATYPYTSNITIKGRGVIDGSGYFLLGQPTTDPAPVNASAILDVLILPLDTTNFTVDGVVGWDAAGWSFTPVQSKQVTITNYKGMQSLTTYQDDGIDVQESETVSVQHAITVSRDDSYSTKTWHPYTTPGANQYQCWPTSSFSANPQKASPYLGVGMCWPLVLSPPPLTDVSLEDVVSWSQDGGFKTGDGAALPQVNLSVDHLYVYSAGYGIYLNPDDPAPPSGVSPVPPVSHIRISNVDIEALRRFWLYWGSSTSTESDLTLSNVNIRPSGVTNYVNASPAALSQISFQNVSVAGLHLDTRSDFAAGTNSYPSFQLADVPQESFLSFDSSNPIQGPNFSYASPVADVTVQATTDNIGVTDVLLTQGGDHIAYDNINFGHSSSGITLRVNPSKAGVTLNLYAGSLSSSPVATWTSSTSGWQTTPLLTFVNSSGAAQPLFFERGFIVDLANSVGTVHVNWLQPTLTSLSAAQSATLTGGATTQPCTSCSSGRDVENITNGAGIEFPSLNFNAGSNGTTALYLRLAAAQFTQGTLNVYLDTPSGTPIGSLVVSGTGGLTTWQNVAIPFVYSDTTLATTSVTGTHNLYIVASCANAMSTYLSTYPTCSNGTTAIVNIDTLSY